MIVPGLLVLAALGGIVAPEPTPSSAPIARGAVVPKVACEGDAHGSSYALFLPSSYDPKRSWPILYLIDPSANGAAGVEQFRAAAEEYGWILAGSNDAKNGPMRASLEAVQAVWTDTHRRFAIDERRAYVGGFSGGARAAVLVGELEPTIAGVIGFGAGFPEGHAPDAKIPFAYFGAASTTDFNFWELWLADRRLGGLGKAHRLVVFEGTHDWPPPAVCREAVEWMELQAVAAGAEDRKRIDRLFERRLEKVAEVEAAGRAVEAHEERDAAAREFRALHDVTALDARLARDASDSKLQRMISEKAKREDSERRALIETAAPLEAIRSAFPPPPLSRALRDLRIADLKRRTEGKSAEEALGARRMLEILFVQTGGVLPEQLLQRGDWSRALLSLSVAAEIRTDAPNLWYRFARAHAGAGDAKTALADLRTAVEKGFKDRERIEAEPAFASLRNDPAYKELVARLAKS